MSKVIVCDCCKKPYASWHYDNPYNSSNITKFCNICGSYCSIYDLDDNDIEMLEEKHKDWLKKQGRII